VHRASGDDVESNRRRQASRNGRRSEESTGNRRGKPNAKGSDVPSKIHKDVDDDEREIGTMSACDCIKRLCLSIPMIFWLLLLLGAGGGVAISLFLSNDDDDNNSDAKSSASNTSRSIATTAPTGAPTSTMIAEKTQPPSPLINPNTPMDPMQFNGDADGGGSPTCDFAGFAQPHVVDQCRCFNEVRIVDPAVQQNYETLKQMFTPTIYDTFNESMNSCTARNQALLWLASGNGGSFDAEERDARFALAVLFISSNGQTWQANTNNWLSSVPSCNWEGVRCNGSNRVESLDLEGSNAMGTLPRELVLLNQLTSFNVANNELSGVIPPDLFLIGSLENADFRNNNLSGELPSQLSSASSLKVLLLNGNRLAGTVGNEICKLRDSNLETFVVDCPVADAESMPTTATETATSSSQQPLQCSIPDCCTSCG